MAYAAENKWQGKREPWGRGQATRFVTHSSSENNKISPFFFTSYFITFSNTFPFFLSTDNHTLTEFQFLFKFGNVSN